MSYTAVDQFIYKIYASTALDIVGWSILAMLFWGGVGEEVGMRDPGKMAEISYF